MFPIESIPCRPPRTRLILVVPVEASRIIQYRLVGVVVNTDITMPHVAVQEHRLDLVSACFHGAEESRDYFGQYVRGQGVHFGVGAVDGSFEIDHVAEVAGEVFFPCVAPFIVVRDVSLEG